jgi:hypothetical protein
MAATASPADMDALSRTPTLDSSLSEIGSSGGSQIITDWSVRGTAANDFLLRTTFTKVLQESLRSEPADRLVMYDAVDDGEVRTSLGAFRKRYDPRRGTKPGEVKPGQVKQYEVCTPFNHNGFHFGKIRNERERMIKLALAGGRYDVLTNKFPLFPKHMLLVCQDLVPQQMTQSHLASITQLLAHTTFCAYYNSWCASASVNHFHCHVIDEFPPVTAYPLVPGPTLSAHGGMRCLMPHGFPGHCYVFPTSSSAVVAEAVYAMQADNQPHNLLFTPSYIYVFPKPLSRPTRSQELYPETVGGPELIGSFTLYTRCHYDALTGEGANELMAINTAPLPSRLLLHRDWPPSPPQHPLGGAVGAAAHLPDLLPDDLHEGKAPEDRPIARALSSNMGIV